MSVDFFDKLATCQKVWDRLLSGVVFDALVAGETESVSSVEDVEQLVASAGNLPGGRLRPLGKAKSIVRSPRKAITHRPWPSRIPSCMGM